MSLAWLALVALVGAVTTVRGQRCVPLSQPYLRWWRCQCATQDGSAIFTTTHALNDLRAWSTKVEVAPGVCSIREALMLWDTVNGRYRSPPFYAPLPRRPAASTAVESHALRLGYARFGASLYKLHSEALDWEGARRACASEGAHLAVVHSSYEASVLQRLFGARLLYKDSPRADFAFIGFHDQFNEGQYLTIYGEPLYTLDYSRWWSKGPDNVGQNFMGNPGEDCGAIHRDGGLNDLPCGQKNAFFCEVETSEYLSPAGIDYSAGAYVGVEAVAKPLPGRVQRKRPGPGYELFPGVGFYKLHTTTDTWENARRKCEAEGGHLAIINSEMEASTLQAIFKRHPVIHDTVWNDFALVGFHDQFNEGQYVTVYGEPLSTTGYHRWWSVSSPDNLGYSSVSAGEDCGSVHRNGGLNDISCYMKHAFFCEQELLE
ncbi:macrophage mannose receptor 1-like [Schistocerca serialis cubense]|uniref:macrophage mannose receptor 1-like n=1 Tax=Schistocerca serialis cubense TaxID=2023355 RepID=UPI00214F2E5A|nr:macrophage mannose receptor 1-like [Schistocerca serialis cubense]